MIVKVYTDSKGMTHVDAYPDDFRLRSYNGTTVFNAEVVNDKNLITITGEKKRTVVPESDEKLKCFEGKYYSSSGYIVVDDYLRDTYEIGSYKVKKYKEYHERTFVEWLTGKKRTYDEHDAIYADGKLFMKGTETPFMLTAQKYVYTKNLGDNDE
jgi:hypothetical protein